MLRRGGVLSQGKACFERVILLSWACFVYSSEGCAASPDLDPALLLACSLAFHLHSSFFSLKVQPSILLSGERTASLAFGGNDRPTGRLFGLHSSRIWSSQDLFALIGLRTEDIGGLASLGFT